MTHAHGMHYQENVEPGRLRKPFLWGRHCISLISSCLRTAQYLIGTAFSKVELNIELSFLPKFYEVKGRSARIILILAKVRSKFYM